MLTSSVPAFPTYFRTNAKMRVATSLLMRTDCEIDLSLLCYRRLRKAIDK